MFMHAMRRALAFRSQPCRPSQGCAGFRVSNGAGAGLSPGTTAGQAPPAGHPRHRPSPAKRCQAQARRGLGEQRGSGGASPTAAVALPLRPGAAGAALGSRPPLPSCARPARQGPRQTRSGTLRERAGGTRAKMGRVRGARRERLDTAAAWRRWQPFRQGIGGLGDTRSEEVKKLKR